MTGSEYSKETISQSIHTKWAGKTVHFAEETDSTNLWIKRLAADGADHGTLAVTEFQSAGRGRLGRTWQAPRGSSVMMSLLLRPEIKPEKASMLTLVMGLSAAQAAEKLGIHTSIKWPNDVVASKKKLCGILTEMVLCQEKIDHVVIGTGINVNIREFPPEIADKATSFFLETGRETDRSIVPGLVLEAFEKNYDKFIQTQDLSGLKEDYERILANKDQPVRVLAEADSYEGIARGITDTGELLVERTEEGSADGSTVRKSMTKVSAGEVSVRGLYSYV